VTTLTLNIDLADVSGIQRAITALQRLVGNVTACAAAPGLRLARVLPALALRVGRRAAPKPPLPHLRATNAGLDCCDR
jgi:hypothetical protein